MSNKAEQAAEEYIKKGRYLPEAFVVRPAFIAGVEWQKNQILNWVKEKQEKHKGYSDVELVVTLKDLVEKVL